MALTTRTYVPRVNSGGNYCGHQPDAPRLDLVKPTTTKTRPKILTLLQERVRRYYAAPDCLPSLRAANQSKKGRQQRSERREACLQLLSAILEFTDLTSLRCGVPTPSGFLSLTLDYLVEFTGLQPRRAERAMADLKRANLLTVNQARQLQEDGSWRGLAGVKAVNKLLFSAFGLGRRLRHERDRAAKRLAKKVAHKGGTLTGWARSALVLGGLVNIGGGRRARPPSGGGAPPGVDPLTYQQARTELLIALKQAYPEMPADERNAEAERILQAKLKA